MDSIWKYFSAAPTSSGGSQGSPSSCPVTTGGTGQQTSSCPIGFGNAKQQTQTTTESKDCGCAEEAPNPKKWKNPKMYSVYGQEVDPNNMMPRFPQRPHPEQQKPLPVERVPATIRRGGTDGTWLYPSEQMFFHALKRKGKGEGIKEEDMAAVVAIHNGMNEKTWQEVMKWERAHASECDDPTLLRFKGRPFELSPKALLRRWLGGPVPFDRHDWIVDRCGKEVRYIIDFYHDEHAEPDDVKAVYYDRGFLHSSRLWIDARPALDSWEALYDRLAFASGNISSSASRASSSVASTAAATAGVPHQ
nr:TPA_exp: holocytochrome c synthase [Cyanoptyche gloeocystis]